MPVLDVVRPTRDEYDPYYQSYVDRVESTHILEMLAQQRDATHRVLSELSEKDALFRYAPEKWSIKEVLGHLIDSERVFGFRALSIARGERQSLPGFDQDEYVATGRFDAVPLERLVTEYLAVRSASLALFENFAADAWPARGVANDVEVTVRAIAYILTGHELHHLAILRERYIPALQGPDQADR